MAVLETHTCENCGKPTVVARISPCDEPDKLTGMWLQRFDWETQDFPVIGVLCRECVFKLCDEGKVSLGFSGGYLNNLANWEAILEKGGEMARSHIMGLTPQQNSHLDWDKREFGVAIQSAQQVSTIPRHPSDRDKLVKYWTLQAYLNYCREHCSNYRYCYDDETGSFSPETIFQICPHENMKKAVRMLLRLIDEGVLGLAPKHDMEKIMKIVREKLNAPVIRI